MTDNPPLLRRTPEGVWMIGETNESVSREIASQSLLHLGHDPNDFRLRDGLLLAIHNRLTAFLDAAHRMQPPEQRP